jgi:integrase
VGRKANWPPRVRLHKQSGQARCFVRGKWEYLGKFGTDAAAAKYAALLTGGPPAKEARPAGPTVADVIAAWIDHAGPKHTAKELASYRVALAVLACVHGRLPAARFSQARLAEVRDAMVSGSWLKEEEKAARRKAGLGQRAVEWCRSHTNRQVTRIKTVWRWAESRELVPAGSWAGLRVLKAIPPNDRTVRHAKRQRPAAREDLDAVLAHVRSGAVKAMLELQYWSGMRSGEVRELRAGEVDTSGEVWLYRPPQHKGLWRGQSRVVPIGPGGRAALAPLLEGRAPEEPVFRTRRGRPYSANAYGLAAARAGKKCGREWFRPYSLRHGAKDRFTRAVGLDCARAMLGQKSLTTTAGYGEAADLELALRAARAAG